MSTSLFWGNLFKPRHEKDTLSHFLKGNVIFQNFSNRDIRKIEKLIHIRKFKKDDNIFKEGEPGTGMYIIRNGTVKITRLEDGPDESKIEKHLVSLKSAHFFGELSLIETEKFPRNASAYAETDCELLGFFKPDLHELIERNPRLSIRVILRISELIGTRLRATTTSLSRKIMLLQKTSVNKQQESER